MGWNTFPGASESPNNDDFTFRAPYFDKPLLANLFFVPLALQQLLRHPRLASHPASIFLQYALLPISIALAVAPPITQRWRPWDAAIQLNMSQSVVAFASVMKALELALANPGKAYYQVPLDGAASGSRKKETSGTKDSDSRSRPNVELAEMQQGPLGMAGWLFDATTNHRGIGWSWGIPPDRLPAPHRNLFSLLRRIFTLHIIYIPSIVFIILSRNPSISPALPTSSIPSQNSSIGLQRLGLGRLPGREALGDALLTLAFGHVVIGLLDLTYSIITLLVYLIQATLAFVLPSFVPAFDWRRWPPLFDELYATESITDLWAKRWHTLFRRGFEVCAFRPGIHAARTLGASKAVQRAVGVVAVFMLSGLLHESAIMNLSTDPSASDPSTFPSSLVYFALQPVGMILFDPLVTRVLRGPRLRLLRTAYVLIFTLATARPFRQAYLSHRPDRVLPAIENWSWHRWIIPGAGALPKGILVSKH